jgi:O-antigen/teichoic acid export membrane protein
MGNNLVDVAGDSARSGSFLAFGMSVATVILSIGSIVAARILGPELYGQYTLVLVGPQLLFLFTDLGINQGIIKLTADLRSHGESDRVSKIVNTGILLRIIAGTGLSILLYVFAEPFASILLNRADMYPYLQITAILILFQALYSTAVSAFVGVDRAEFSAITSNMQAVIRTLVTILLLLLGFNLLGALAGNILGYAVAGICGIVILKMVLPKRRNSESSTSHKADAKALVQYGIPIFATFLLTGFTPLYQNMILGHFTTDIAVGNFKAALNFATTLTLLSFPITTALLSGFSKLDSITKQNVSAFFKLANKYTSLIVFPVITLLIFFSGEIVQIIYGPTYEPAAFYLALYCLLYFSAGIGYLNLASFYNGIGETKTTFKIGALTFVLVAFLSPVLAQFFEVTGLIVAFLVANVVGTSYGAYVAKRKHDVEFSMSSVGRILIASLISAVPAILLRLAGLQSLYILIGGSLIYVFFYLTLVPLLNIITESELENTRHIIQRIGPLKIIALKALEIEQKLMHVTLLIKRQKDTSTIEKN